MIEFKTGDRVRLLNGYMYIWHKGFGPKDVYGMVAGEEERAKHFPHIPVWLHLRSGKKVTLGSSMETWPFPPSSLEKEEEPSGKNKENKS